MILNSEQKFVVLLNFTGISNIFNLRALLPSSSGHSDTEELTGPSFFQTHSFTTGNTEVLYYKVILHCNVG